jgi:hypothetical protein
MGQEDAMVGQSSRWRDRGEGDAGQVGIALGLLIAVIVTVGALLLGTLGGVVNDRARARTAADATALAAVTGGATAAAEVARANDGELERYADLGVAVEATVRVGRARATSRAAPARR